MHAFSDGRPNHGEAAIHESYHINFTLAPLGCGAFATVVKGIEKTTRNTYAVKIIKRPVRSTDIPSDATIDKEVRTRPADGGAEGFRLAAISCCSYKSAADGPLVGGCCLPLGRQWGGLDLPHQLAMFHPPPPPSLPRSPS